MRERALSRSLVWILAPALALAACASRGGWEPTIDPQGGDLSYLEQDKAECRELAKQASGGTAKESAKGAALGGLVGAAAGAAVGAIAGAPGRGAAIGGAAGGIGGGARGGFRAEDEFKQAYSNCLRGRGYRVIN